MKKAPTKPEKKTVRKTATKKAEERAAKPEKKTAPKTEKKAEKTAVFHPGTHPPQPGFRRHPVVLYGSNSSAGAVQRTAGQAEDEKPVLYLLPRPSGGHLFLKFAVTKKPRRKRRGFFSLSDRAYPQDRNLPVSAWCAAGHPGNFSSRRKRCGSHTWRSASPGPLSPGSNFPFPV